MSERDIRKYEEMGFDLNANAYGDEAALEFAMSLERFIDSLSHLFDLD